MKKHPLDKIYKLLYEAQEIANENDLNLVEDAIEQTISYLDSSDIDEGTDMFDWMCNM
jgi:hypothetical protein